jgi:hypothetical protein
MELALGGQLKLPQWIRRDHEMVIPTLANKSLCPSLYLPPCVLAYQFS